MLLISLFAQKQSHTFHDFEDVWNELQFSLIHYSCLYKEYRNVYLNTFYTCALEYMHSPSDIYRSGAIFALYFLYHSQPQVWKKAPIRVDKGRQRTYRNNINTKSMNNRYLVKAI